MKVSEMVRANQDTKEMTRRAIKLLIALDEDAEDLKREFESAYGEAL